jgi:hypothetical protein
MSTVALMLAWPAPFPASEIAAALTLSGKSTIANTSVSPKAKIQRLQFATGRFKELLCCFPPFSPPVFCHTLCTVLRQGNLHEIFRHKKSSFQIFEKIEKPAHPGDKSPERLALNSPFHFPLRRTACVLHVRPHITLEAFSMTGEASYERTNITLPRAVKQVLQRANGAFQQT